MIVKMIQNLGNRIEKMQVMLTKGLEEIKNRWTIHSVQFSCSIISNSVTPCTAASQSYLPITKPQNLLKLISIESVIKSKHLILCCSVPFFSCLQNIPESESFPVSQFFNQVAKALELQLQHQSFQWILRTNFLSDWLDWSPYSPCNSQESSQTPVLWYSAFFMVKSINSLVLSFLYGPALTSILYYWKNRSFDYGPLSAK